MTNDNRGIRTQMGGGFWPVTRFLYNTALFIIILNSKEKSSGWYVIFMQPTWRSAEKIIPVQHPQTPFWHWHGRRNADARDPNGLAGGFVLLFVCLKSASRDCADLNWSLLPVWMRTKWLGFLCFFFEWVQYWLSMLWHHHQSENVDLIFECWLMCDCSDVKHNRWMHEREMVNVRKWSISLHFKRNTILYYKLNEWKLWNDQNQLCCCRIINET